MAEADPNLKDRLLNELSSSFGPVTDGLTSEAQPPPPPPVVPDHTLLRRIGKGSYGEVWLARTTLGTFRAVKIVYRRAFDSDRPYEREFAGIRRFEPVSRTHPSQLNVLHVGRDDAAGLFYYVMELADDAAERSVGAMEDGSDGLKPLAQDSTTPPIQYSNSYTPRTLRSELHRRGRLPSDECLQIGLALATALDHLHRHGLVHRDIKPSNIVFVNGIPKLADIGLVTHVEATLSFVGTEGYLPPEGPGTPPADIFSLGKVLYEMATGRDRQDYPELPTNLIAAPAADRAALAEFNEVIVKACHADAKQRYQTAAELHADLALLQSGKSVSHARAIERRLRFVQRAGAIVTVIAVFAAGLYFWQSWQTRLVREMAEQNRSIAAEKTRLAAEKSALAEGNRDRLVRLDIANGVRLMDQEDYSGALFWFTEALALATNNPSQAAILRIRINQLLARQPRLLNILPHPASVLWAEFSPDERRIATGCADGRVCIWDLDHDDKPEAEFQQDGPVGQVRFTRDGSRLLVVQFDALGKAERVTLLNAASGTPVFAPIRPLTSVVLSPDDHWLAVASANNIARIISMDTGQTVAEAIGHQDRIQAMSFSPDSTQLLTAGRDCTIRHWEIPSGRPIGSPLCQDQPVEQVVFNADATRIASATSTRAHDESFQFQTWDATKGKPMGKPLLGWGLNCLISFDRSGRRLLTGDRTAVARVWDGDSHAAILPALNSDGAACSLDFTPDGVYAAIGSETGSTRIWDLDTGLQVFPVLRNRGRIQSVQFNADGSRLLTASEDGQVNVWDLTRLPVKRGMQAQGLERPAAAALPNGHELLLGVVGAPCHLQLLDLTTLRELGDPMPSAYPGLLALDRTGTQWVNYLGPPRFIDLNSRRTDNPGEASLWRREGIQIRRYDLPQMAHVGGAFFNSEGSQLLTCAYDRMVRIWNTVDGTLRQTIPLPEGDGIWVTVSPDLRKAVARSGGEGRWHMLFRDVQTGKSYGRPAEQNPDINAAAFSPDGIRVATVGENGTGRIWDARTGEPLTPEFEHVGKLRCIEWSPDAKRVLSAGLSPEVKVWDPDTGQMVLPPLQIKGKPVSLARFSADGRFIVGRSDENLVRVWDAATGDAVTPLLGHPDSIVEVFFTAAHHLVTVQNMGEVRVWDLTESADPVSLLADYAKLLASGSLIPSGISRQAETAELAGLLRSLRTQQPALSTVSRERLVQWHQQAANDPTTLTRQEASVFHLKRLAQLEPEAQSIQDQLQRARAGLIPPRDPGTPRQLLDLTRAYTHSFDLLQRRDLADLPRGRQKLGGIDYDLRGLIQLDHRAEWAGFDGPFHSMAVIEVGQRCRVMHFLQAVEGEPRINGSTVARWIIHYADGSACEWPVIYGEHVRDWWWWTALEPLEASQATIAWRGRSPICNPPGTDGIRLFHTAWTNPRPDVEIAQLEYRIGETALKPLVVAITVE